MDCTKIVFGQQAFARLFALGVEPDLVTRALKAGEIIEENNGNQPSPHSLVLYIEQEKPLHVVAAKDEEPGICYVVAVYRPDRRLWNDDYKTRRTR